MFMGETGRVSRCLTGYKQQKGRFEPRKDCLQLRISKGRKKLPNTNVANQRRCGLKIDSAGNSIASFRLFRLLKISDRKDYMVKISMLPLIFFSKSGFLASNIAFLNKEIEHEKFFSTTSPHTRILPIRLRRHCGDSRQ